MKNSPIPFPQNRGELQIWRIQDDYVEANGVLIFPPRPKRQNQQLMVLKDSEIKKWTEPSCPNKSTKMHKYIVRKKLINKLDDKWTLNCDIIFNSPSTAANVILGMSKNGWDWWKHKFDLFPYSLRTSDQRSLRQATQAAVPGWIFCSLLTNW